MNVTAYPHIEAALRRPIHVSMDHADDVDDMRISVVIPAVADCHALERCLESLSQQTRTPEEILIVVNEHAADVAALARKHDARIVVEPRNGMTAASARGFDEATGDIIARCSVNSIVPRNWLALIEFRLRESPAALAVTGPTHSDDAHGVSRSLAQLLRLRAWFVLMRLVLGRTPLVEANYAVRAFTWNVIRGDVPRDDAELHDAMDLTLRLPRHAPVLVDHFLEVRNTGRTFGSRRSIFRRLLQLIRTFTMQRTTLPLSAFANPTTSKAA